MDFRPLSNPCKFEMLVQPDNYATLRTYRLCPMSDDHQSKQRFDRGAGRRSIRFYVLCVTPAPDGET